MLSRTDARACASTWQGARTRRSRRPRPRAAPGRSRPSGPILGRSSVGSPSPPRCKHAQQTLDAAAFDVVHVLRLYLAPFLDAASGQPRAVLDLDDDEVETRRRIAVLHAARGEAALMTLEAAEADKYRALERAWLGRFDDVLVCSARDRAAVIARTGHPRVGVIPNGVRREGPARPLRSPVDPGDGAFRLLFVGTLGYFPNVDAAATLCRDVLPRLRARSRREVRVDLVGARPAPAIAELAQLDGVEIHADVARVAPFYERAGAAVAPLRAGGGTRIKLLEAFAQGVPVVSTSLGAEGLDAEPGRHILIADDADGLADACWRLMEEPALRDRLRGEALRLVAARYETARVIETIRTLLRGGLAAS